MGFFPDWMSHPITSIGNAISGAASSVSNAWKNWHPLEDTVNSVAESLVGKDTMNAIRSGNLEALVPGAGAMLNPAAQGGPAATPGATAQGPEGAATPAAGGAAAGAATGARPLTGIQGWIHENVPFLDQFVGNKPTGVGADGKPAEEGGFLSGLFGKGGMFSLGGEGESSGWGAKIGLGILGAVAASLMGGMGLIGALLVGLVALIAGPSLLRGIGSMVGGLFGGGDHSSQDTPSGPELAAGGTPAVGQGQGKGASAPAQEHKDHPTERGGFNSFIDNAVAFAKHPVNSVRGLMNGVPAAYYNAMDFFESKDGGGYSKQQSAGIVASLHLESGVDPYAVGDGGKAKGIGQWHPDRQADFKAHFGHAIDDKSISRHKLIEEQLAFVTYEMNDGKEQRAGNALRLASTAAEAGAVFRNYYERPADKQNEANRGAVVAEQLANANLSRGGIVASADTGDHHDKPAAKGDAKAAGTAIKAASGGDIHLADAANDPLATLRQYQLPTADGTTPVPARRS